jgi:hypothetical protein
MRKFTTGFGLSDGGIATTARAEQAAMAATGLLRGT